MRASRLLQILLLLQNRGQMSSLALAEELEVSRRTILRDVDAMTEAGLPILTNQGSRGGIELGFNYRTRLTGLAADEAEALAVILTRPMPELAALNLAGPAAIAIRKLLESMPDAVRDKIKIAQSRFRVSLNAPIPPDPRVAALAEAIRQQYVITLNARSRAAISLRPLTLEFGANGWVLWADAHDTPFPACDWHDINISRRQFSV